MMDQGDAYTSSRLLYKCDRNIAVIYAQAMRAAMGEDVATDQLLREIDNVIFQNFKYKTALVSLQKDHEANKASQSKAGSPPLTQICKSRRARAKSKS